MYQLLVDLLRPYTFLYLVGLIALASLWRRRGEFRRRYALLALVYLGIGVCSTPLVAYFAAGTLEWRYPSVRDLPDQAQAIVVLGGSVRHLDPDSQTTEPGRDTIYRCTLAAELYHQADGGCPVFVCGGKVNPDEVGPTVAQVMAEFLMQLGVPADAIVLEDTSLTTFENVVNVAAMLRERGIQQVVLVTEATHLLRSELCFEAVGVKVFARGAYYRADNRPSGYYAYLPDSGSLWDLDRVAHEWIGLAWYLPKIRKLEGEKTGGDKTGGD